MAFKFSEKDRTIRIYNLRADTREFIGAGDAYIPANTGLPADCTNIAPPTCRRERSPYSTEQRGRLSRTTEIKRSTAKKQASAFISPRPVLYLPM